MAVAFRNNIYSRSSNEPSGGGLMFNVPHLRLSRSIWNMIMLCDCFGELTLSSLQKKAFNLSSLLPSCFKKSDIFIIQRVPNSIKLSKTKYSCPQTEALFWKGKNNSHIILVMCGFEGRWCGKGTLKRS